MNGFEMLFEKIAEQSRNAPCEGDFRGEDGLLYCGNCRKPKEIRQTALGKERILCVPCICMEQQWQKEQEQRKMFEKQKKIQRNRENCFPDRELINWRFSVANGYFDPNHIRASLKTSVQNEGNMI